MLILLCSKHSNPSVFSSSTHLTNKNVLVKIILVVVLQKENIHPCFSSFANLAQKADKLNSSQINYPPNIHTKWDSQPTVMMEMSALASVLQSEALKKTQINASLRTEIANKNGVQCHFRMSRHQDEKKIKCLGGWERKYKY